jgi:hypothetical protein
MQPTWQPLPLDTPVVHEPPYKGVVIDRGLFLSSRNADAQGPVSYAATRLEADALLAG